MDPLFAFLVFIVIPAGFIITAGYFIYHELPDGFFVNLFGLNPKICKEKKLTGFLGVEVHGFNYTKDLPNVVSGDCTYNMRRCPLMRRVKIWFDDYEHLTYYYDANKGLYGGGHKSITYEREVNQFFYTLRIAVDSRRSTAGLGRPEDKILSRRFLMNPGNNADGLRPGESIKINWLDNADDLDEEFKFTNGFVYVQHTKQNVIDKIVDCDSINRKPNQLP